MSRRKEELEARKREREQRLDFLGFQVKEIEAAGLRPGEWEELLAERNILKNSEKVALLVEAGLGCAYAEEGSVSSGLSKLQGIVGELARYDQSFEAFGDSLAQSGISVRELADTLIKFKERQHLGPERLEELEARLSTIEKLRRKYGETTADILAHLVKAKQESEELARSEEALADLETGLSKALAEYKVRAKKLSRLRSDGASGLQSDMEKEMALLGLRRARFQVRIETASVDTLAPEAARNLGLDEVEFLISPNPGEELRPLRRWPRAGNCPASCWPSRQSARRRSASKRSSLTRLTQE
jgi:DNA repair protein RecN (Recombination protein N)